MRNGKRGQTSDIDWGSSTAEKQAAEQLFHRVRPGSLFISRHRAGHNGHHFAH
jgi:hypothetical protein